LLNTAVLRNELLSAPVSIYCSEHAWNMLPPAIMSRHCRHCRLSSIRQCTL